MLYYYLHFAVDETGSEWLSDLPGTTQLWTTVGNSNLLDSKPPHPAASKTEPQQIGFNIAMQLYENADMRWHVSRSVASDSFQPLGL